MGLIGNYSVLNKVVGRTLSGTTGNDRADYNKANAIRNKYTSLTFAKFDGVPRGYRPPYSLSIAQKDGGMSTVNLVLGSGSVSAANLAGGYNLSAALAGSGDLSSTGQLIISLVAALSGSGSASADIVGVLNASASLTGTGTISASDLRALANIVSALIGSGSLTTADLTAIASISADILPYTELSPESLANSIWNSPLSSYTTAGTAGKALADAGGSSSPETIATAVWDEATSSHSTSGTFGALMSKLLTVAKFMGLK